MQKQKKYDWQDTNLALFGSDLEKKIKQAAADGEDAWDGVGTEPSVKIWRIEKFQVKPWPERRYGEFYTGDSYIVLRTYKPDPTSDKLAWDIHFWIGKESTQDEYGTAAYKTVELDAKLQDRAVQHRQIQENETKSFLDLFKSSGIRYLEGGIDSGFNKVEEESFEPKLLHVKGVRGAIILKEVERRKDSMNSGDVFLLDTGDVIYQWNGSKSNVHEKMKAQELASSISNSRSDGTKIEVLEEDQSKEYEDFWKHVPGEWKLFGLVPLRKYRVKEEEEGGLDTEVATFQGRLFRLREKGGKLTFKKIASADRNNQFSRELLDSNDAFILDDGFTIWAWVGKKASVKEKGQAILYAHQYLKGSKSRPDVLPIVRVGEGNETAKFNELFHDGPRGRTRCTLM